MSACQRPSPRRRTAGDTAARREGSRDPSVEALTANNTTIGKRGALGEPAEGLTYEQLFLGKSPATWQSDTFNDGKTKAVSVAAERASPSQ